MMAILVWDSLPSCSKMHTSRGLSRHSAAQTLLQERYS